MSGMWADFNAKMVHPNGTTVEISTCTQYYPEQKNYASVEIEIPEGALPVMEEEWPTHIARTLREIAMMLEAPRPALAKNARRKRLTRETR